MIIEDKPALNDALLEHHGVKGMKWGQRNKSKPSDDRIRSARVNVAGQQARVFNAGVKATSSTIQRKGSAGRDRQKHREMKAAFLKNPDRATALRLTKGEKALHAALLLTPAAPIAVRNVGTRVVARKAIERQQANLK